MLTKDQIIDEEDLLHKEWLEAKLPKFATDRDVSNWWIEKIRISNSHLSAQYEKLIEEVMPPYKKPSGSKAVGFNLCLHTIRTSLQERGIIIK